ncbi:ABC transporter permease subunit [Kitasatospora nipponensis]|uniref:ABC transporter permease subunit n=1 Tax=Kitasatospora nipponensis TaxID=258049 RepID=A0ABP4DR77_9ACTN
MNWLSWLSDFFSDPDRRNGPDAIAHRLAEHLTFCGEALAYAALLAVPLGLLLGYTGRATGLVTSVTGIARGLPTLGLVTLAVLVAGVGDTAVLVALVALAAPVLLVAAVEGVRGTDPALRDAARGIGLTHRQVLWQVCVPSALPALLAGLRTATVQVIATATVAAYVGLGGLGRYVLDGLATHDFPQTAGGALLVVLLALGAQGLFVLLNRFALPAGLRGARPARTARRPRG